MGMALSINQSINQLKGLDWDLAQIHQTEYTPRVCKDHLLHQVWEPPKLLHPGIHQGVLPGTLTPLSLIES